jgi:hypothetical protein
MDFLASRPGRFTRGKELPVHTESETASTPEPVETLRRGKEDSASTVMELRFLQSSRASVSMSSEVSRF